MTKQEFDKIVAKYEEHKAELDRQYNLGKLHGLLEAMRIMHKELNYVPEVMERCAFALMRKI